MKVTSAAEQPTQRGGQASFSLFGIPGFCRSLAPVAKVPAFASARRPSLDNEPELAHSRWLADLAEGYGCPCDEEAAAFAHSFAGAGYAEHLMALEG